MQLVRNQSTLLNQLGMNKLLSSAEAKFQKSVLPIFKIISSLGRISFKFLILSLFHGYTNISFVSGSSHLNLASDAPDIEKYLAISAVQEIGYSNSFLLCVVGHFTLRGTRPRRNLTRWPNNMLS